MQPFGVLVFEKLLETPTPEQWHFTHTDPWRVLRIMGDASQTRSQTRASRIAAYAARHAAKNVVASGLADRCEIQLAYAIGVAEPVSTLIETFGTGVRPDLEISKIVQDTFDFRPRAIIQRLNLRRPIYKATAAYGHFGRNEPNFTWELTDYADVLAKYC